MSASSLQMTSDMISKAGNTSTNSSTPLEARQRIRELTPLGYMERPEDIYGTILFLASVASN
ncbi:hypothetical protein [Planctomycetes bacterium CA13]|uniref:hypothetical protein n=1 Tax=Novipirellula herctigrandis TaxID=2527986 RepID=UPI0011B775BB